MTDKVHKYVSSNPYLTVVMTVFLMLALYYSQGGAVREGPDVFTTFSLTLVAWIILGVQQGRSGDEDTFDATVEILGLSDPLPGYNINMSAMGIGVALLLFQFSSGAASIYGSATGAASIFQPLYNPFSAFPNQFSVATSIAGAANIALYNFLLIGLSEELFKYLGGKNLGNAIYERTGLTKKQAALAGFGWILPVWMLWHFLSWTLSLAAVFMAISYGAFFLLPWIITEFTGALSSVGEVSKKYPVLPAIVTHGMWNTLVGIGGTGLDFSTVMVLSALLIVVPVINMLWISGGFEISGRI